MRRHLNAEAVAAEPHLVWNAFIDLIAIGDYDDMSAAQRVAHLAFWYHSEVQNGGHHQFFANSAGRRANDTVVALGALGLKAQASVLALAVAQWQSVDRQPASDAEEFNDAALDGEFDAFDDDYHACTPTVIEALQGYFAKHQDEFVVIE